MDIYGKGLSVGLFLRNFHRILVDKYSSQYKNVKQLKSVCEKNSYWFFSTIFVYIYLCSTVQVKQGDHS